VTRFPKDINVPSPQSLLFYPAMAYVVEVVCHALPLVLLLAALLRRSTQTANTAIVIWLCIAFVSYLEPVLVHLRTGSAAYVGVFVFVFTLVEPYVFRRYDFMSMYAFRLVFYMWWHVTCRCPLIFCDPVDFGHRCMRWRLQRQGPVPK